MTATGMMTDSKEFPCPLKVQDFSEICRICLLTSNLQPLKSTQLDTLCNILNIKINEESDLPNQICFLCLDELNVITAFIQNLKINTDILKSLLLQVKSENSVIGQPKSNDYVNIAMIDRSDEDAGIFKSELSRETSSEIPKAEDCVSDNGLSTDANFVEETKAPMRRIPKSRRANAKEKRIFLCNICGKHLTRESTLKDHLRMHTGERRFECQICGFKFTIKRNLTRHLAVHGEEKKFQCNYCGKRLTQKKYLERHIRNFHKEPKPRIRKEWKPTCFCPTCGRGFASNSFLERHVVTHVGYKDDKGQSEELRKEFLCTHCGKQFTSKCNLERHIVISHTGEKKYECQICGNKYTIKSSLDYHMNVHEGRKPFACHFCTKTFRQPSALRKHILVHTGERKFKCHICDKAFKTSTHLRTHFKIHALV